MLQARQTISEVTAIRALIDALSRSSTSSRLPVDAQPERRATGPRGRASPAARIREDATSSRLRRRLTSGCGTETSPTSSGTERLTPRRCRSVARMRGRPRARSSTASVRATSRVYDRMRLVPRRASAAHALRGEPTAMLSLHALAGRAARAGLAERGGHRLVASHGALGCSVTSPTGRTRRGAERAIADQVGFTCCSRSVAGSRSRSLHVAAGGARVLFLPRGDRADRCPSRSPCMTLDALTVARASPTCCR